MSYKPGDYETIENVVAYGERWGNTTIVHVGHGQEIGHLQLDPRFADECRQFTLHPALLDDAASNSQYLPHAVASGDRYLPFSYSRITVRAALPPQFSTFVRHLDAADGEIITADVTLIAPDGTELVAIEGYSMRRINAEQLHSTVQDVGAGTESELSLEVDRTANLDLGIAPAAGLDALDRILQAPFPGHVIVCPEGLGNYFGKLRRLTNDLLKEEIVDIQISSGQTMERLLDNPYVAPQTEMQRTLATLWAQALGLDQVGVDDDFFDLGGNSLVAVQLGARIRRVFEVEMPLAALFEQPTVQTLAGMVEKALVARLETMSDADAQRMLADSSAG